MVEYNGGGGLWHNLLTMQVISVKDLIRRKKIIGITVHYKSYKI